MSDYLSTLAARTRSETPSIRPRLLTLFETPTRTGETPQPESQIERSPVTEIFQRSPAPTTPEPVRLIQPVAAAPVPAPEITARMGPVPVEVRSSVEPVPSVAPRATDRVVPVAAAAAAAPSRPTLPAQKVFPEVQIAQSPVRLIHLPISADTTTRVPRTGNQERAESAREPQPGPRSAPTLLAPAVRLVDLAARTGTSQGMETRPPETSTINVTIGRVEVRAVVPAPPGTAPGVPARKRSPVISLDDYLKQESSRSARA
jgi:hypothetical protein